MESLDIHLAYEDQEDVPDKGEGAIVLEDVVTGFGLVTRLDHARHLAEPVVT